MRTPLIASAPSCTAVRLERPPWKEQNGVRAAAQMHTSAAVCARVRGCAWVCMRACSLNAAVHVWMYVDGGGESACHTKQGSVRACSGWLQPIHSTVGLAPSWA